MVLCTNAFSKKPCFMRGAVQRQCTTTGAIGPLGSCINIISYITLHAQSNEHSYCKEFHFKHIYVLFSYPFRFSGLNSDSLTKNV